MRRIHFLSLCTLHLFHCKSRSIKQGGTTMKTKRKPSCVTVAVLTIGALVLSRTMILPPKQDDTSRNEAAANEKAAAEEAAANAGQVKEWRQSVRDLCTNAKSAEDVKAVERKQMTGFLLPLPAETKTRPRDDSSVKGCRNVFIDFGANIGDSSGHLLNSGMVSCDRTSDLKTGTSPYLFSVVKHNFEFASNPNAMVVALERLLEERSKHSKDSAHLGPEDYCYYGIEGNPTFTKRLQGIEDFVMAIKPRPVEHMHFFTESVGAGEDGMTKLYLDTINTEVNYWGSSVLKEHNDVRASAGEGNDVGKQAAPVMGYTIGTLMRKTLQAFSPTASSAEKKGGHLILKVDIEGGEHALFSQAARDRTLCEYIAMGNTVDVYIEWHGSSFFGGKNEQLITDGEAAKQTLEDCGVKFLDLEYTWQR
jgi:Methyltransferase FkbM domain